MTRGSHLWPRAAWDALLTVTDSHVDLVVILGSEAGGSGGGHVGSGSTRGESADPRPGG
jgi:hypothetical protein